MASARKTTAKVLEVMRNIIKGLTAYDEDAKA
jgi:hypothetical protein